MYIIQLVLIGIYLLGFVASAALFIVFDYGSTTTRTGVFGCLLMALFWPILALVVFYEGVTGKRI